MRNYKANRLQWRDTAEILKHCSMIQNTQEIKRTLFNETKQDKTCTFSRKSFFFKLCTTTKTENQTINSTYLVSVAMEEAGGRKMA